MPELALPPGPEAVEIPGPALGPATFPSTRGRCRCYASGMHLHLGIDGGGSNTRAVLLDDTGRVVGRGAAGPSNLHHAAEEVVLANLAAAIRAALAPADARPARIASAFFGMAGVTRDSTAERYRALARRAGLETARVGVDHDIRIALAGGLAGRPGIALIVGTGSSCYGRTADGRTCQTGGWGCLVADEGSGYDLGRRAIIAAVRMSDGRQPLSPLRDRVFRWLEVRIVSEILERLYERGIERHEIAAFAPEVIALAGEGDPAAAAILDSGASDLTDLVVANHRQLPTAPEPEIAITGGLGSAPTPYRERILSAIRRGLPGARVRTTPEFEPVLGAALLALEQAGFPLSPERIQRLRESSV